MRKVTRLFSSLFLVAACSKSAPEPTSAKPDDKTAALAARESPSTTANEPAAKAPASAGGLTWRAEPPLLARPPKSAMRAAEYTLESDSSAELTVFYFGEGQGGDVDSNLSRWLGQFAQADGSDTAKHAKRSERTVGGLPVTLIEVTGVYSGGMAPPGAPPPSQQGDAMLLGAIAKGPKGPVFFKLTGKRSSLESARAAFDALVDSLHAAP